MQKRYYFLAGLPRTGNTVLSALLNQHPEIYCSTLGPLCEYMWLIHSSNHELAKINTHQNRTKKMLSSMINNYYYDVDKKNIIDRQKSWANIGNVNMIKQYIDQKPKIIYTIRPVEEMLASFININQENTEKNMKISGWQYNSNISKYDNMCDFLMSKHGSFSDIEYTVRSMSDIKNKDIFCIVKYKDLLNLPQETMSKIYNFLNIENFKNDFNNIEQKEKNLDSTIGVSEELHLIRKNISKGNVDTKKYVSEYIRKKYNYIDKFFDSLSLS